MQQYITIKRIDLAGINGYLVAIHSKYKANNREFESVGKHIAYDNGGYGTYGSYKIKKGNINDILALYPPKIPIFMA